MNTSYFIFQLTHIPNFPTLAILIPLRSPYAGCAHLFADYGNTSIDCTDFSTDYANKYDDSVDTFIDSTNTFDKSSLDLYIPNSPLL
jgi:hypothetical protein